MRVTNTYSKEKIVKFFALGNVYSGLLLEHSKYINILRCLPTPSNGRRCALVKEIEFFSFIKSKFEIILVENVLIFYGAPKFDK